MKHTKVIMSVFFACAMLLNACKKSESAKTTVTVSVIMPTGLDEFSLKAATLTFKEVNSGRITTSSAMSNSVFTLALPAGSYNLILEGEVESNDGKKVITTVKGVQDGLIVNGPSVTTTLSLFSYKAQEKFRNEGDLLHWNSHQGW